MALEPDVRSEAKLERAASSTKTSVSISTLPLRRERMCTCRAGRNVRDLHLYSSHRKQDSQAAHLLHACNICDCLEVQVL